MSAQTPEPITPEPITLVGGRVLAADGPPALATLVIEGGMIAAVERPTVNGPGALDAGGALVLPGIVDLHGDAFERELMPRPGVRLPVRTALKETDRRLVANGVTTAFHGVTYSFEPGLRGRDSAVQLLDAIEALGSRFACDTRIHLRHEVFNVDGVDDILGWLAAGRIGLLAFNDHLALLQSLANSEEAAVYAGRAGVSTDEFRELLRQTGDLAPEVWPGIERLAAAATTAGVPCLSHDDETAAMRQRFHAIGCALSEFPINAEVAAAARALGDDVVLGAPNVLRGGSHCARLDARAAVGAGLCTILTSDYYYPALLYAPFLLALWGVASLAEVWPLVAAAPAGAAGLTDRGVIAAGRRADLIIVDDRDAAHPEVIATFVAGRPVYGAGSLAGRLAARGAAGSV